MKKNLIFLSLVALLLVFGTSNLMSQEKASCDSVCKMYVDCAEKLHKKKFTKEQTSQANAGCMATCSKKQDSVLQCYQASNNACKPFYSCLMKGFQSK